MAGLDEVTPGRLKKIATARARVRRHVWTQLPDGLPASKVGGTDLGQVVVLDVDATIVIAHSGDKEQASPTFKRTFGFHPLGVWCDNTSEFLAGKLRAGNAGSNTAADHIEVLTEAIAQVPGPHRKNLLIRSDGGVAPPTSCWTGSPSRARSVAVTSSTPSGSRSPSTCARLSTWCPGRSGHRHWMPTAASATGAISPS